MSGCGGLDMLVAVSVAVSGVDTRETHIDADGAPIVDLCTALKVSCTLATGHDETSETLSRGLKASVSCRAEHV